MLVAFVAMSCVAVGVVSHAPDAAAAMTTTLVSPNAPAMSLSFAAVGDIRTVQFEGIVGQVITISASGGTFIGDCGLRMQLRNPAGTTVGPSVCTGHVATIGPRTIGMNGIFQVELQADEPGGTVSVAISATAAKRSITPDAPGVQVRVGPGGTVNLGFRVDVGELIGASTDLSDDCLTTVTLVNPDGSAATADACAGTIAGPFVTSTAGVHRVRLRNSGTQAITLKVEVFTSDSVTDLIVAPGNVLRAVDAGGSFEVAVPVQAGHFVAIASSVQLSGGVVTFLQPDGAVLPATDVFVRAVSAVVPRTGVYRVRISNTGPVALPMSRFDLVTGVHVERSGTIDGPVEQFDLQPADRFTLRFAGIAGQSIDVKYPAGLFRCVTLQRPDGSMVRRDCGASPLLQIVDTKLDVTGTWAVVVQSTSEFARSSTVQVVSAPDPTLLTIDGPQARLVFSGPEETSHLEFNALAGQKLVIAVTAAAYQCSGPVVCRCPGRPIDTLCPTVVELVDPRGVVASGSTITTSRSPEHDPSYLRATISSTGTWTIRAVGAMAGAIGITVIEAPDLTSAVALNLPFDAVAGKVGQRDVVSFPVEKGKRYGLVDVRSFDTFGREPLVEFIQPDGSTGVGGTLRNDAAFVGPFVASATGTARVVLIQLDGALLDERVKVVEVNDLAPVMVPSVLGTTSRIVTTGPTQVSRFTFSGTVGARITTEVFSFSYPSPVTMRFRLGDRVLTDVRVTSTTAFIDPIRLDATGTWTVEIDAPRADVGGLALRLRAVTDIVRSIVVDGASQSFTLTQSGQRALIVFPRSAGRRVRVRVADANPTQMTLRVLGPDGAVVQTCTLASSNISPRFCEVLNPPTTGNYTVVIDPLGIALGAATIGVISA